MNILLKQARICAVVLASLAATSVNAASTLSLSGPATVAPGDTFDVIINGDFPDGLAGGGTLFGWDDSLVTLNSITLETGNEDPAFSCPGNAGCEVNADSAAVWWATFSGNIIDPGTLAPVLMATISLTANAAGVAALSLVDDPGAGGWFDAGFGDATPTFSGTSVLIQSAVVPVPAAVWLFGSGLLGLVGVARRRKAA